MRTGQKQYWQKNWVKRIVNFRHEEIDRLDAAAREQGYKSLHHFMRSTTLKLLLELETEKPTAA